MEKLFIFLILVLVLFFWFKSDYDEHKESGLSKADMIQKLLRQAARWSIAAEQDELPMIAVLHANYGAGYLWALKDIASNEEIEKITGMNMMKVEKEITRIQDEATKKVYMACPQYGPDTSSYLVKVST